MSGRTLLVLLSIASLAAAGCGEKEIASKTHRPKTTYADITVKGENLAKANRYYGEGNQLYFQGGVGVAERERKRNLVLAIKRYRAARAIYAKAHKRHPDHLPLTNRIREVDMNIEGCQRMINMNVSGGDLR